MTEGILIIGAGGHGKVIADMIKRQGLQILGFVDDNPDMIGQQILGFDVLDTTENWDIYEPEELVIGIGDNAVRQRIATQLGEGIYPTKWRSVIHMNAIIADSTQIGVGTVVMAGAIINPEARIGDHVIINTGATIDHDCHIDDFAHVAPGVHLAGQVRIGKRTLLGIGCSVIPGCTIGDNVIIGAGAVVTSNIPSGVVAKGVPARWEVS